METCFDDFRESNEFLNLLLDNINVAVLIADENLRIHHFNDTFLQLFARPREAVLAQGFGGATGCKYRVDEEKACGETSYCTECPLRRSLLKTMVQKVPVDKVKMKRSFYIAGTPVTKHLEITTRSILYQGREMILVILYDVTETEEQKIQLQEKQQQIDQDLEAAAGIQRTLLPDQFLPHHALDVAWKFEPSSRVGGDIFNICYPDEHHIDFYMLDVCGHGVAAALIAVSVSQVLRSRRDHPGGTSSFGHPELVLNDLNRTFPFERFDSYFTMVYLSLDLGKGVLAYGCAGHPPPLILCADGALEVLDHHGPSIGVVAGAPFGQKEKKLHRGDKVVLYTDGITEVHNPAGKMFDKHKFYEILKRYANDSPRDLVEAAYSEVKGFRQTVELEDDISLLVAEYQGDS